MIQKYRNKKIEFDGQVFDSKKEFNRYIYLKRLQEEGTISGLERQVRYLLLPTQRVDGKVVERECSYIADFVYRDEKEERDVVEDTKGFKTEAYRIKRKLMLYIHGIRINEV